MKVPNEDQQPIEVLGVDVSGASPTVQRAAGFLAGVVRTLVEKNQAYGDAAAAPLRVFSDAPASAAICVRIDDKLSRIRTLGAEADAAEDTLADLVGYLALLAAVRVHLGRK